ncbi:MAG: metallophosphoesterase [Acidobacteriota bacterium]|nr:metallophosphoesterase [Acidobacteriota bacterium]
MKTLIHLSDLHFGRVDYQVADALIEKIHQIAPDLVVVSGDLTQRARSHQFKEARHFLDSLPKVPQIVVPGNHDVPLYNIFDRFTAPLEKYKKYITADLRPFYADDEIAVLGVNTARSLTIKGGRINEQQIEWIRERLCPTSEAAIKIIVTHHPFDLPEGYEERDLVGRARIAMKMLASCGADVFLAGHLHVSHISETAKRYRIKGHSALVIQAGTATSTRERGEDNSFNLIRIDHPNLSVERLVWQPASSQFETGEIKQYRQIPSGWEKIFQS